MRKDKIVHSMGGNKCVEYEKKMCRNVHSHKAQRRSSKLEKPRK